MIGTNVRLIAKQHRFELILTIALALLVAAAAALVSARLLGVAIPDGCAGQSLDSPVSARGCSGPLSEFSRIYFGEASMVLAAMAVLPAALGLLGGVPLVGRELEGRTAQFAWSIAPSRRRWLLRQVMVVGGILLLVVGLAALASSFLEAIRREVMPASPFENIGLHGPIALARMFAALMVGLFVGGLTGRTLPAFIVGALVMLAALAIAGNARDFWASSQEQVVIEQGSAFDGQVLGLGWIDEAGRLYTYEQGAALVPADTEVDGDTWLTENGYEQVDLGITRQKAESWSTIELLGWVGVGLVLFGASTWVTSHRRPR